MIITISCSDVVMVIVIIAIEYIFEVIVIAIGLLEHNVFGNHNFCKGSMLCQQCIGIEFVDLE